MFVFSSCSSAARLRPRSLGRVVLFSCLVGARSGTDVYATANFDDGTPGPFRPVGLVSFPEDPTGAGRGRVAQFRYSASDTPVEINSSLVVRPPPNLGYGSTFFFAGDFYAPRGTYNFANPAVDRKLLSFHAGGMTGAGPTDTADVFVIIHLYGCGILVHWSGRFSGSPCRLGPFDLARWYHIETQVTMNSSVTAADGILRLWVNGKLTFEDTTVQLTKPAWRGTPTWQTWAVGEQRRSADLSGGPDISDGSSIDELRYWDDIAFTRTRPTHRP